MGMLIGKGFCATTADVIGRKSSLCLFMGLLFIVFLIHPILHEVWEISLIRLLFGAISGAVMPLNSILLGEVVGREHRGRYQAMM
jgi:MFS family permease